MNTLTAAVVRRHLKGSYYNTIPAIAKDWAATYEKALKRLGARRLEVKLVHGGNVKTQVETMIDGEPVPTIIVQEHRVSNSYSVLKWVRIDSGPGAKFIKAPTKMAQYVVENYANA